MIRLLSLGAMAALLSSAPLLAQASEVLALERGADRRGRDALYAHLARTRVDIAFEARPIDEVARFLAAASGNAANFVVWTKAKADIAPLTLELRRAPLTRIMDLTQRLAGVRFVYRAGLVLIERPDEVKEYTSLRLYDVRAATMSIPDRPGPRLGLRRPGEELPEPEEVEEGAPVSGFTTDKLIDVLRSVVEPDSWDRDGISISSVRGVLWVRQTDRGHREVLRVLRQLGVVPAAVRSTRGVPTTTSSPARARRPKPSPRPRARRPAPTTRSPHRASASR